MKTYTADYRVHTNQAAQVSLHDSTSDRGVRLEGGGGTRVNEAYRLSEYFNRPFH